MPNNPRRDVAREYLGLEHRYAETMLARIDAVDPMRREPSAEAVEAAIVAFAGYMAALTSSHGKTGKRITHESWRAALTAALTAALAVMAGESVAMEAEPPADPKSEWTAANDKLHAAMVALLKLAACDDAMPNRKDACYVEAGRAIEAAFPIAKPAPAWPPKDCKLADCERIIVRLAWSSASIHFAPTMESAPMADPAPRLVPPSEHAHRQFHFLRSNAGFDFVALWSCGSWWTCGSERKWTPEYLAGDGCVYWKPCDPSAITLDPDDPGQVEVAVSGAMSEAGEDAEAFIREDWQRIIRAVIRRLKELKR